MTRLQGDVTAGWEEFGNDNLTKLMQQAGVDPSLVSGMCGPIAAAGILRAYGINVDPGQLAAYGQQHGIWNGLMLQGNGTGVQALLQHAGLPSDVIPASGDNLNHVIDLVQNGTPVVANFPNHYVTLQKYDPVTGKFFVGSTGSNALKNGSDWMSWAELNAHPGDGGAARSFIVPTGGAASQESAVADAPSAAAGQSPDQEPLVTRPDTSSRAATVASIEPLAQYYEKKYGIPAAVLIAINIHEGGNGVMAAPFGIKGPSPQGTSQNQGTFEYDANGNRYDINDNFASYPTLNDAYQHFFDFVQGPRYKHTWDDFQAGKLDWKGFLDGIVADGYATDKQWGTHIANFAANSIAPLMGHPTSSGETYRGPSVVPGSGVGAPTATGYGDQSTERTTSSPVATGNDRAGDAARFGGATADGTAALQPTLPNGRPLLTDNAVADMQAFLDWRQQQKASQESIGPSAAMLSGGVGDTSSFGGVVAGAGGRVDPFAAVGQINDAATGAANSAGDAITGAVTRGAKDVTDAATAGAQEVGRPHFADAGTSLSQAVSAALAETATDRNAQYSSPVASGHSPEMSRDYFGALDAAFDGNFKPLVTIVARNWQEGRPLGVGGPARSEPSDAEQEQAIRQMQAEVEARSGREWTSAERQRSIDNARAALKDAFAFGLTDPIQAGAAAGELAAARTGASPSTAGAALPEGGPGGPEPRLPATPDPAASASPSAPPASGASVAPTGAQKQPWEMTRSEWYREFGKKDSQFIGAGGPGGDSTQKGSPNATIARMDWQSWMKMGLHDTWDAERGVQVPARHKEVIEEALRQNQPVPENVLAEYPDLAARARASADTTIPPQEPPRTAVGVAEPPPSEPRDPLVGRPTEATSPSDPNVSYTLRPRVVSLDDLVPSHTDTFAPNPAFPQELQPRARGRAGSQAQVHAIASNLQPDALLAETRRIDAGPPIVGADNIVESGNGRTLALRLARDQYPEKWAAYQEKLPQYAAQHGIDPQAVAGVRDPVLVMERTTPVDRAQFAATANEGGVLASSPFEVAMSDARRIPDSALASIEVGDNQSVNAALTSSANRPLVRQILGLLPQNERAALLTESGELNAAGLERIKAALFAKTYPGAAGQRLTRTFVESLDPGIKNVEQGLFSSLPSMARAEGLIRAGERDASLSLSGDLAAATDMLARLREQGMSVAEYRAQASMFARELNPTQEALLGHLDELSRSAKRVRGFVDRYAQAVEAEANPAQASMFGAEVGRNTKGALIERASQGAIRDEAAAGSVAAPAANPAAQPQGAGLGQPAAGGVPPQATGPAAAPATQTVGGAPPAFPPTRVGAGTPPAPAPSGPLAYTAQEAAAAESKFAGAFTDHGYDPGKGPLSVRTREQLTDDKAALEYLQAKVEKLLGGRLPDARRGYDLSRVHPGVTPRVEAQIYRVQEMLQPVRKVMPDVRNLWYAERFQEVHARFDPNTGAMPGMPNAAEYDLPNGLSVRDVQIAAEQSRKRLAAKGLLPQAEQAVQDLRGVYEGMLQRLHDQGLMNDEQYAGIKANNEFYAPMKRAAFVADRVLDSSFGAGSSNVFSVASNGIKKLAESGSRKKVLNPWMQMEQDIARVESLLSRNQVAAAVHSWDADLPGMFKVVQDGEALPQGWDTFSYIKDGQKVRVATEKWVADAMTKMTPAQTGLLGSVLHYMTAPLRLGAVTLSPAFAGRNIIRDPQAALINVGTRPDSLGKGLVIALNAQLPRAVRNEALWQTYMHYLESGAAMSGLYENLGHVGSHIAPTFKDGALGVLRLPFNALKLPGEISEQMTRIGTFVQNKGQGKSDLQAAMLTRDSSFDYQKGGTALRYLNQAVPFLNARLQSTLAVGSALKNNPGAVARLAIFGLLPELGFLAWNLYNDKTRALYDNVASWERQNYHILVVGERKQADGTTTPLHWAIPKDTAQIVMGTIAEAAVRAVMNDHPDSWYETARKLVNDVSPLGTVDPYGMAAAATPPPIKALMQDRANWDYFRDAPIIPKSQQDLNAFPDRQVGNFTTETAKQIGGALGVSPRRVETFAGTTAGTLARSAMGTRDLLMGSPGAKKPGLDIQNAPEQVPGLDLFLNARGGEDQNVQDQAYQQQMKAALADDYQKLQQTPLWQQADEKTRDSLLRSMQIKVQQQVASQMGSDAPAYVQPATDHPAKWAITVLPQRMRARYANDLYALERDISSAVQASADYRANPKTARKPTRDEEDLAYIGARDKWATPAWQKWAAQQRTAGQTKRSTISRIAPYQPVGSAP